LITPKNRDCWSCSFLNKVTDLIHPLGFCRLCVNPNFWNRDIPTFFERVLDHLNTEHNISGCNQRLFFCKEEFQSHLVTEHNVVPNDLFARALVGDFPLECYWRNFRPLPQHKQLKLWNQLYQSATEREIWTASRPSTYKTSVTSVNQNSAPKA